MKNYMVPITEIARLNLAHGVMQGDDNIDFNTATSVEGGDIESNTGEFDEEESFSSGFSSLWDS